MIAPDTWLLYVSDMYKKACCPLHKNPSTGQEPLLRTEYDSIKYNNFSDLMRKAPNDQAEICFTTWQGVHNGLGFKGFS